MKTTFFQKLTGASLLAVGLAIAPASYEAVQAQDTTTQETVETDPADTAGQNFEDAEESLEQAGQETIQGIDAAGEAAEQSINQAAQEAAQEAEAATQAAQQAGQEAAQQAEEAAQRAELAAENAVESIDQRSNWGWLGLLGLIGLFGLAGGSKRRSDADEHYYRERPTTTTGATTGTPTGEYRSGEYQSGEYRR